jgi:Cys-tRNA(Pro) deacylase
LAREGGGSLRAGGEILHWDYAMVQPLAIAVPGLTIAVMVQKDFPKTNAIRCLREHGIAFEVFPYQYEERGGTRVSARELGVDEHLVVKTLVMETDAHEPLIVLMHGDCEVSTRQLARRLNVKSVQPCDPKVAQRHSGYMVGGTSPFGTKRPLPVYCEAGILDLDRIYINAGARGLLVRLNPRDMAKALNLIPVQVAIPSP